METIKPISDAQRLVYRIVRTNSERTDIYNLFEELRSDFLRTRLAPGNAMVPIGLNQIRTARVFLTCSRGGIEFPSPSLGYSMTQ
jgi:hypothetical protein